MTVMAASPAALADEAAIARGKYVFDAGGCYACHTDIKGKGQPLAGGAPLVTPFGTFYAPNITPDPTHGIGRFSDEDFLRAMRRGIAPGGHAYYPAFPYTTYAKASERDLLDLKAYLFAQAPVAKGSRPHEVGVPFSFRVLLWPWRWLNFDDAGWTLRPDKSAEWNRGAYLVEALSHCGECHTPRNAIGAVDRDRWMAGAPFGTKDEKAPNLTPDASGLADWSLGDIEFALEFGATPDGGAFSGEMSEVVQFSTSKLTKADRRAIAVYLKGLPPLPSAAGGPKPR